MEKQGAFGCLVTGFVFHFISSWSPFVFIYLVVCKCVIHPCFLGFAEMFSSLQWLCFIVSTHLYLYCALYCSFCCFSFLHSLLVWQKPRSNHRIFVVLIFMFCFGACIPTLHLAQRITPTPPREGEPSKWYFFALFVALNNVPKYLF